MRDVRDIQMMFRANAKLVLLLAICFLIVIVYFTSGSAALTRNEAEFVQITRNQGEGNDTPRLAQGVIFSGYSAQGKGWTLNSEQADLFSGNTIKLYKVQANSMDEEGKKWILLADKGYYDRKNRSVFLEGHVDITSDSGEHIQMDTLSMDLDTDMLTTEDNITIYRNKTIIEGVGADADRELSTMIIKKNVIVTEQPGEGDLTTKPRVTITCDGQMDIDYKKNFAIFYDNVKVIDKNSVMFANKMHVYFDPVTNQMVRAIAYGDVEIITSDKRAVGDKAVYVEKTHTMVLTGNPYVYRENDVITADKITFYTEDGRMVCEPRAKLVLFPSKKSNEAPSTGETIAPDLSEPNTINSI